MARVPVTTANSVERQALGGERVRYANARDFVGGAVTGFGQALGQAAEAVDRIEATFDEADALRLDNELRERVRERTLTGENAYLQTRGFAAGDGAPVVQEELDGEAERLLSGARSGRARELAQRAFNQRLETAKQQIGVHAVREVEAARLEQSQARIDGAVTDAIDARGTDQFAVNLGLAQQELISVGTRQGWSPEKLQEEGNKLVSGIFAQTVLAIDAEDGEPTRALSFLEENKDAILPAEQARLASALAPRVDGAWAKDIVQSGALDKYLITEAPAAEAGERKAGEPLPRGGNQGVVAGVLTGEGRLPAAVVAGFLGNFEVEGGYGGARGDGGTAAGIAQWRGERRENFRRQFGKEPDQATVAEQAKFVVWEMNNPEAAGMTRAQRDRILAAKTPGEAAALIDQFYERSSGQHRDRRMAAAERFAGSAAEPGAPGVAADPRLDSRLMRGAVDKYVADNPGLSERRVQALYAAADQSVNVARADRAQAEADADRRLLDWLDTNKPGPDDLTSIDQIPASVMAGLSPGTRANIENRIQQANDRIQGRIDAQRAAAAAATEEAAVFELYAMSDEELARVDIRQYIGRVPPKTLGPWIDRQQAAAEKLNGGGGALVDGDRIAGRIDTLGKDFGASRALDAKPDERKLWADVRGYVEERVSGRPNKDVTDEELRAIILSGMQEVTYDGSGLFGSNVFAETGKRAQAGSFKVSLDGIPAAEVAKIRETFKAANIPNPTTRDIFDAYQRARARGDAP